MADNSRSAYSAHDSTPTERAEAKENLGCGWKPWECRTGRQARRAARIKMLRSSRWLRNRMAPVLLNRSRTRSAASIRGDNGSRRAGRRRGKGMLRRGGINEPHPDGVEVADPAPGAVGVPAVLRGTFGEGQLPLLQEVLPGDAAVEVIPRQNLVKVASPVIEKRIDSAAERTPPPSFSRRAAPPSRRSGSRVPAPS